MDSELKEMIGEYETILAEKREIKFNKISSKDDDGFRNRIRIFK